MDIYRKDGYCFSIELLYVVEGYFTYNFMVVSGKFKGEATFCLSESYLKQVKEQITRVLSVNRGEIKILDYDSESFLDLYLDGMTFTVRGKFGNDEDDNSLKFEFLADQTFLQLLKSAL